MKLTTRTLWIAASCILMIGMGGCQFAPEKPLALPSLLSKDKEPIVPDRMMVIWTDTVLHQPQQPGVRGFGGRAYFYHGKDPEPIEVDGGLAVYAFDANNMHVEQTKPERKFVFTADQLSEHLSRGDMGPSYSIWLPWDQVGGVSRQLSLVTRFEGRNGGVVISEPTIKLLPGSKPKDAFPSPEPTTPNTPDNSYVRTANHIENATTSGNMIQTPQSQSQVSPQRRTETIDLPPSFYRHLMPTEQSSNEPSTKDSNDAPSPMVNGSSQANFSEPEAQGSRETHGPSHEPSQSDYTSRYSFRRSGDYEPNSDSLNRTKPLQAGWIRELPRTPRRTFGE